MKTKNRLNKDDFAFIVKNTPLVSIDLLVKNEKNKILVGLRKNEPAKGFWFVPGGRILKNETIKEAFNRITKSELGEEVSIENSLFIGVFEHIYETNFAQTPGFGTHYIVLAYKVKSPHSLKNLSKDQHNEYQWVSKKDAKLINIHPNTRVYLNRY
jgi:colanic acid biosynthesis protein WcaH